MSVKRFLFRVTLKVYSYEIEKSKTRSLSRNLHLEPVSLITTVTGNLSRNIALLLLIRLFNVHKIMLTRRYYERNCA